MAGFWYPYAGPQDALRRIGAFADRTVGPASGISFSDGRSISVLRKPHPGPHGATWLNVLRRHASHPHPIKKLQPPTVVQRLEHWFEQAMTAYGESQMREAEANMAMSRAVVGAVDRTVYQPVHQWLLRHKLIADGLGVALDVVGVVAGVAFCVFVLPEIGVVAGLAGIAATGGSLLLLGADGAVFATEMTGHEALSRRIEDSQLTQWARIVGTVMTLPDMAVGGVKALKEIGALAAEGREATAAARTASDMAEAQRARAAKISHPAKHPHAVQKHLHKARRFAREAITHTETAAEATRKLHKSVVKDIAPIYGATPAGAALLAAAPPDLMKTEAQKKADEHYMHLLSPEGGMPHDVRLDMRVSRLSKVRHP